MTNKCNEQIVKRKQGEAKYFDVNDKRFEKDPFEICVQNW